MLDWERANRATKNMGCCMDLVCTKIARYEFTLVIVDSCLIISQIKSDYTSSFLNSAQNVLLLSNT
jgi:hypothetical protein